MRYGNFTYAILGGVDHQELYGILRNRQRIVGSSEYRWIHGERTQELTESLLVKWRGIIAAEDAEHLAETIAADG